MVIVNHNQNQSAIHLKSQFAPFCKTLLLDSGSSISEDEKSHFDFQLPNVYYSGLLNQAVECLNHADQKILLFIASDVTITNAEHLLHRVYSAFFEKNAGVYAPSADYSSHNQMAPRNSSKMSKVTFTDGFCFAASKQILNQICPVDLSINYLGHGLDIYLGFLAMKNGIACLVDYDILVNHAKGSGYDSKMARMQRDNWYNTKSLSSQIFHNIASIDWLKNRIGLFLLRVLLLK